MLLVEEIYPPEGSLTFAPQSHNQVEFADQVLQTTSKSESKNKKKTKKKQQGKPAQQYT